MVGRKARRNKMKKKILLINPRWGTAGGIWKGVHSVFPPIGLLSIAAVLEQAGHEVKVFDANVEDSAMYYKLYKPDVVGITITTTTANSGYATAKECKRLWPNCKTIMGEFTFRYVLRKLARCVIARLLVSRKKQF